MHTQILITWLNDFIFCPRSIYFHHLYGRRDVRSYQEKAQMAGSAAHASLDKGHYSTRKELLTGIDVYCERYNLTGKIDQYDGRSGSLIERKKKIKIIYDGYIYQLYGQYFSMIEMGYPVQSLALYSMDDNKSHPLLLPHQDPPRLAAFEQLIKDIQQFRLEQPFRPNPAKCRSCIYRELCDKAALPC